MGLIGFGWLGQAHSRSMQRIKTLFPEREFDPELVICSDTVQERLDEAVGSFGYRRGTTEWARVVGDPDVDVVFIAAPNAMHLELIEAAAAAGKDVFCEKPVGGTPAETARAERAARRAGVISGVGYNYRWAPLVRYAAQLVTEGRVGRVNHYRGRFFSMYGSDPLGLLSWRFLVDEGGHGVTTDLMSHSVDLAHMLRGADRARGGHRRDVHPRAPAAGARRRARHYGRGAAGDPVGAVTNEDYAGMLCVFENGARGTFEAGRTLLGPESQMAFDLHGERGRARMEPRADERAPGLPRDRRAALGLHDRLRRRALPYHGAFVPGSANGIGFEDLVVIEDFEFCRSVVERPPAPPGLRGRARRRERAGRAAPLRRERRAGRTSCRCGRTDMAR